MKKFLKIFFVTALLSLSCTFNIQSQHRVRATKYYAGHNCGHITADGSRINNNKVNSGEHRWVALSRDMFRKGYKMGDVIYVDSDNVSLKGYWVVKDKMGARHSNCIDFLMTRTNSRGFTNPCHVTITKTNKKGTH